jgi:hypothetical protein
LQKQNQDRSRISGSRHSRRSLWRCCSAVDLCFGQPLGAPWRKRVSPNFPMDGYLSM